MVCANLFRLAIFPMIRRIPALKAMVNAIDGAKSRIQSAMSAIKSAVNVFLKPRLSLPHISVSGRLSLNPPSVPKISVECSAVA